MSPATLILPRTAEERALLRATEALTREAQAAHAEGDDQVSVLLYDRSRETLTRLKEVERILADPAEVLAPMLCAECNGRGEVEREVNVPSTNTYPVERDVPMAVPCDDCGGAGVHMCADCSEPATTSPTPNVFLCRLCLGGTPTMESTR